MTLPRVIWLLLGLACASDDGGPDPNPTAASVAVNGGNTQSGAPAQALAAPLSVIVRDASNSPLAGVTVTWAAASGGGSVNPAASTTSAAGVASTTRTLGALAGALTTTATVSGLAPVTFNAVGRVQGATNMGSRFQSPLIDTVLATTVAQPLIAVIMNETGAPVPGVIVSWTTSGGGQLSQAVDTTDAGGESQVDYTFGATAGTYTAQAAVTGLIGSPAGYTLTAGAGNAAVLVKTGGDNLTLAPNAQVVYTVTTRDAHGNPANGVTIDWAVGVGGGSITPGQNITGGNGTATATRTLGAGLGDQTATATATGLSGSPATFTTTAAVIVQVANNSFTPSSVTVPINGTVSWQWQGTTNLHNVTFTPATGVPTGIGDRSTGSESRAFTVAGTFNYSCGNHPGMNGSVTVTP